MNLPNFLNQFTDSQLRKIYANAVDYSIANTNNWEPEHRSEMNEEIIHNADTQLPKRWYKRNSVRYTHAALLACIKVCWTDKQHDEFYYQVKQWAK
jgi:hypothetical protein